MFMRGLREALVRVGSALQWWRGITGVVALAVTAMGGCAVSDEPSADEVALSEQGLYGNRDFFWPNAGTGRTDINVCWVNPNSAPGSTPTARAAWRDDRRRAVEEAWGRNARINFYGWDGGDPVGHPSACAGDTSTGVHITICTLPTDSRCPNLPGSQSVFVAQNADGPATSVRTNPDHPPSVMVHELGHSLGFYHAEERPDAPDISTGPCAKQSFPNSNPVLFGAYDDHSIMSYCHPPSGAPWLSANDIAGIQRSYGRRQIGSLVTPRGNCAAAHHAVGIGDPAFVWDCDEANRDQMWIDSTASSIGDAFGLYIDSASDPTRYCLAATSASAGAPVQLAACSIDNDWKLQNMFLRGFGGRCLDLQGGNTSVGTPIQMWSCGALGGANQKWTRTRTGQLRYGQTDNCARIGASGHLELGLCNSSDKAQLFVFSNGRIQAAADGTQCLDVIGPSDAELITGHGLLGDGARLQMATCSAPTLNQKWAFSGEMRYASLGNLCLARGSDANGSGLFLSACGGSAETLAWDFYF
jgi:hypothetical protein